MALQGQPKLDCRPVGDKGLGQAVFAEARRRTLGQAHEGLAAAVVVGNRRGVLARAVALFGLVLQPAEQAFFSEKALHERKVALAILHAQAATRVRPRVVDFRRLRGARGGSGSTRYGSCQALLRGFRTQGDPSRNGGAQWLPHQPNARSQQAEHPTPEQGGDNAADEPPATHVEQGASLRFLFDT